MKKFIKLVSLFLILIFSLSMGFCVFAENEYTEPYVYESETGAFIINDLSSMGFASLPAGIFQGMETMIRSVEIKDPNIRAIEDGAFLNCFRLEKVIIPETVESIADGAFWGCPSDLKIFGAKNSAAEDFADEHVFTFKEYSSEDKNTEGSVSEGVSVTILGLCIVFLILIILCVVLKVFEKTLSSKSTVVPSGVQPVVPKSVEAPQAVAETADDTELVAVITAAIAASLNTNTSKFRIKSLRRLGSSWNQAARLQNFNNNF